MDTEHDFRLAWQPSINEIEWNNFLSHTFLDADRKAIYNIIKQCIKPGFTFAEIGFGQCHDFQECFKQLHDTGALVYHGFDITQQFVKYAKAKYPDYDFQVANLFTDDQPTYDITYTRHTFEHQAPSLCYTSFENFLMRTNHMAIVSWFVRPGIEQIKWTNCGFEGTGVYVIRYDADKLADIITRLHFSNEITQFELNCVYVMRKLLPFI